MKLSPLSPVLLFNFLFLSPSALHLSSPFAPVCTPQASLQVIPEDECQLWWAAKEMQRGKKLQDYIGKNEKTKLVVKIQKVGAYFITSDNLLFYFSIFKDL